MLSTALVAPPWHQPASLPALQSPASACCGRRRSLQPLAQEHGCHPHQQPGPPAAGSSRGSRGRRRAVACASVQPQELQPPAQQLLLPKRERVLATQSEDTIAAIVTGVCVVCGSGWRASALLAAGSTALPAASQPACMHVQAHTMEGAKPRHPPCCRLRRPGHCFHHPRLRH